MRIQNEGDVIIHKTNGFTITIKKGETYDNVYSEDFITYSEDGYIIYLFKHNINHIKIKFQK